MKAPTVADLRRHAHDVARAFGIFFVEDPSVPRHGAFCGVLPNGRDVVCARTIDDETSYTVVMHEFGHILHPAGRLRTRENEWHLLYDEEAAAWEWAEHNALGGWTVAMEHVKQLSLGSYARLKPRAA